MTSVVAIVSVIVSGAVAIIPTVTSFLHDKRERGEHRRKEITRFIEYAASLIFENQNLADHSVDLWKRYGVVSYYCTYSQIRAIEDFIIAFGNENGVLPAKRKLAFRKMCFELSTGESRFISKKERTRICKKIEEDEQRQASIDKGVSFLSLGNTRDNP